MSANSAIGVGGDVKETGLTAAEVRARVSSGAVNKVKDSTSRSVKDIVRANVFTLFNGIILAAMILVLATGSWKDAVFGFVIIINTGIGIVTELRAKRTLDRLSILVASDYLVRRDGRDVTVPHDGIVMDDLLWVRSGEQVPADAEIIRDWGLELDESMLTGESRTVRKHEGDDVYSGSTAVSGMALTRVTAVGARSYAATLTAKAKVYKKTVSDLNKGINTILKFMTFLVVPLCVLLIISQIHTVGGWSVALATGQWRQAVVSAVAGVVGMIPEGLVLLTSLNFAVAAMRLARHETLVQELESVETLARVDCLNLDKTGTITDGGIALDRVVMLRDDGDDAGGGDGDDGGIGDAGDDDGVMAGERETMQALYDLANEEQPNATGRAVLDGLAKRGYAPGEVVARVPFSSSRKWSAVTVAGETTPSRPAADSPRQRGRNEKVRQESGVVRQRGRNEKVRQESGVVRQLGRNEERGRTTTWYLGAPEVLLAALDGDHAALLEQVEAIAKEGSRVLLVARARTDGQGAVPGSRRGSLPQSAHADSSLVRGSQDTVALDRRAVPVALVVCSERVRDDAEATLAWFREQGVRCRVISGDNPVTVGAIARKVRLAGERDPRIMDARMLPDDPAELGRILEDVDVVGRVLPDQKKLIVDALHARGYTVAMTGDGVNDALALKEADLGIAMGNAAPATKAVAQVVLVDSKFSHLPDVVARGRQVMANMERVAGLFLVKTVYSALISLGVVLTAIPYPYLPRHITYIGALTIGMPAFILALAPNTRRYIPGFLKRVVGFALPGGIATALSVLITAWTLPRIMGWDVAGSAADLAALRATEAIVLFVMGVFVLARVARPLNGWRGALVAVFAAAGVIGMFIPFVARFFALVVPTGDLVAPTLIALAGAAAVFAVCIAVVPWASRTALGRLLGRAGGRPDARSGGRTDRRRGR
ncbi:HAD-IC family P-type ATPase [Bifidobacterium parmae]|uniref:Haloacid dehalogenase n=1 Tax=Bifidobacterium parmae TaxID=361854 RepID=A0A2N5J330_9BIFI|nr:HAD-IC family P-type ATPase [Bifidobacterium parmae]PLS28631.1 haloacid dehalogenase [Bifidobacterium parmae]